MRLMIVDDEIGIREGLKDTVDWQSLGIDEVLTARNGIEAMKLVQKTVPDLVLADIRMPGMDGLELAEQLSILHPRTKVFLISGYADFAYARQAISIGVENYFVKPVNVDMLMEEMRKAVSRIRRERMADQPDPQNESHELNRFLLGLLDERPSSPNAGLKQCLETFGIRLQHPFQFMVLLEIDEMRERLDDPPLRLMEIRQLLRRSFMEIYDDWTVIPLLPHDAHHVGFFVSAPSRDAYQEQIGQLADLDGRLAPLTGKYAFSFTTSISRLHEKYDFKSSYLDAKQTMRHKFFVGKQMILLSDRFGNRAYETPVPPSAVKEELARFIRAHDIENCLRVLQPLFRSYRFASPEAIPAIKKHCLEMVKLLNAEVGQAGNEGGDHLLLLGYRQQAEKFETLEEFVAQVENYYCCILGMLRQHQASKSNWIIEKAKEYLEAKYAANVTLEEVAEYVQRNPNYLSYLFNRIEGMPFTEYLNRLRIGKAKMLLRTTSLMSYEIADRVGFQNYRYFTQVFKKYEGMSPMQYRNTAAKPPGNHGFDGRPRAAGTS